ncbi:TPA: hypothetical protein DIV48_01685 [Candidatus Kaiserbacteria bacterium]|nr:MAG: hypothetical protein UY93_C0002G0086 [Parcubacteria group bacterium GW2011_GWA1_56_13]HCR52343.1 hypothetical protein [Candidatus Kaiserbacteria bacterium]
MPKILTVILIAVIAGGAGWWAGYSQALGFAKERLAGYQVVPLPPDSKNLTGTIERIDGGMIYVRTLFVNPLEKDGANMVALATTASTTIEKFVLKDSKSFETEMTAFAKAAQKNAVAPVPPEPFTRQAILLSDLKPGESVSVTTAENVVGAARLTATSISATSLIASLPAGPQTSTGSAQ